VLPANKMLKPSAPCYGNKNCPDESGCRVSYQWRCLSAL